MKYIIGACVLEFTPQVYQEMQAYRQTRPEDHEAGGVLLGRVYPSRTVVQRVSVPGEGDKAGRFFFDRSVRRAQAIVNEAWNESNGELVYLGEWHTHPEGFPRPSGTDLALIHNMLRDSRMEIDRLYLTIVGLDAWYVSCQSRVRLQQMHPDV